MGKFIIKKTNTGFVFHLKANNGETVVTSEVYPMPAICEKGAESVKRAVKTAKLEDLTLPDTPTVTHPKFVVYQDKAGEYRFRLKARNGEIIAASEGYKTKSSCMNGIDSVRRTAPDAEIIKESEKK